jgi:hypothetical protein
MKSHEQTDPILHLLSQLGTPASSFSRDRRVRDRCHAAMARRNVVQPLEERRRSALTRVLEVALAAAVSFYGAATLAEAIRLVAMR